MTNYEKSLIGCILLDDRKVLGMCLRYGVKPEWFSHPSVSSFYKKAVAMFGAGKVVDAFTMDNGKNHQSLNQCIESATVIYAQHYIEEVESEYLMRKAESVLGIQSQKLEHSEPANIRDLISELGQDWMKLNAGSNVDMTILEAGNELIEQWSTPQDKRSCVTWPLENMRNHMGDITDDYIFLVARESAGKTALALQMLRYLGHSGITCSFASLESSIMRVMPRLIGQEAMVNTWRLKNGKGSPEQLDVCRKAVETLNSLPMRITERAMDIDQLHAWAMAEKAAGSKFLIVDNMKHIRMKGGNKKTNEHFMEVSMRVKWVRDDVGLPLMMLHHLNEDGDVSWSKDIKRDADILLYMEENEGLSIQPSKQNDFVGRHINDIKLAKNRDGDRNYVLQALFKKPIQTFEVYK